MLAQNEHTVAVFLNLNWEYSAAGNPTGFRPGDVREVMWLLDIPGTEKTQLFHGIRAMEAEALKAINEVHANTR
jgi:hypothetical protein